MEQDATIKPDSPETSDEIVKVSGRSRVLVGLLIAVVIIALALVAFFLGFRFATESDLTVGDILRFLRQLYQWLTIR